MRAHFIAVGLLRGAVTKSAYVLAKVITVIERISVDIRQPTKSFEGLDSPSLKRGKRRMYFKTLRMKQVDAAEKVAQLEVVQIALTVVRYIKISYEIGGWPGWKKHSDLTCSRVSRLWRLYLESRPPPSKRQCARIA